MRQPRKPIHHGRIPGNGIPESSGADRRQSGGDDTAERQFAHAEPAEGPESGSAGQEGYEEETSRLPHSPSRLLHNGRDKGRQSSSIDSSLTASDTASSAREGASVERRGRENDGAPHSSVFTAEENSSFSPRFSGLRTRLQPRGMKKEETREKSGLSGLSFRGVLSRRQKSSQEVVEAELIDELTNFDGNTRSQYKQSAPIEMSARRKEREDEQRRVRRRRLVRIFGILGGVFLLVWTVAFSPFFAYQIDKTKVTGANEIVTLDMVKDSLQDYAGIPLPRLNTSSMERTIESSYPAVKNASVKRAWMRAVKIELTMRTAVTSLVIDGKRVAFDDAGVAYEVPESALEGLGTIEVKDESEGNKTSLALLRTLDPETLKLLASISVTQTEQVTFTLSNGATVKWGSAKDNESKAKVLRALLASVQARTYDVSAPKSPVTSP